MLRVSGGGCTNACQMAFVHHRQAPWAPGLMFVPVDLRGLETPEP